jgi:hypothetical protein
VQFMRRVIKLASSLKENIICSEILRRGRNDITNTLVYRTSRNAKILEYLLNIPLIRN